jgi:protease IV
MALEADILVDRRRLRRKLIIWRVFAIIAAMLAIFGLGLGIAGRDGVPGGDEIARISVKGVITSNDALLRVFEDAGKADRVKAVIVAIDSPGGTVTGSEALYDAVRDLSAKKPTVAVIDSVGASGGYITAIAADRIYARSSAIVGSIGVIAQFPNLTRLLTNIGVDVEAVRSSPLKATPSGFEPTTAEARAALEVIIRDNFDWFRDIVKERRGYSEAAVAAVADGRVFTGRQAVPLKLIDDTGDEKDAIAWLESNKGVAKALPVRDWRPKAQDGAFSLLGVLAAGAERLGAPNLAQLLSEGVAFETQAKLDGILFLWRP